jgi:hypothetical protein
MAARMARSVREGRQASFDAETNPHEPVRGRTTARPRVEEGAGELTVFLRVVLPLGIPAIASHAIFQFLFVWNDLLVALVFASPSNAPLTVAIREQTRQFGANLDVIST